MARFHLTPNAKASLKAIGRYTELRWGKAQRNRYLHALDKQFHALAKSPLKGRTRDDVAPGLRSFLEGSHIIFYVPRRKDIVIIDVLHQRMDPLRPIVP